MNCSATQKHLNLFVSEDLGASLAQEVERHLSSCVSCSQEHVQLATMLKDLEGAHSHEGPHHMWSRVSPHLDAIDATRRHGKVGFRPWRWLAPTAAAAALFVFAGMSDRFGWFGDSAGALKETLTESAQVPSKDGLHVVSNQELAEFLGRNSGHLRQPARRTGVDATPAAAPGREF